MGFEEIAAEQLTRECPDCREQLVVGNTGMGLMSLIDCPYCGHTLRNCAKSEEDLRFFLTLMLHIIRFYRDGSDEERTSLKPYFQLCISALIESGDRRVLMNAMAARRNHVRP